MSNNESSSISVAITGSGGSGVVTAGHILLAAAARAGMFGLMSRSSGPQIRGGESAAMLRIATLPVHCMAERFDVLLALDWRNMTRFAEELPLDANSLIIRDPAAGDIPAAISASGARVMDVPLKQLAKEIPEGRPNMIGLGGRGILKRKTPDAVAKTARKGLSGKTEKLLQASEICIAHGYRLDKAITLMHTLPVVDRALQRWNISGNEASGLGALRGGVRFVAAYPITPATEMLEWLAPRLEQCGGTLLQAEDELASVNMLIGASFGGVPSLTATSGPGLSLMMEGLGLAVASESPIVVANVMRGGPSTGIPTKTEQSDLNIALYGLHGDAPHLVLAALNIGDCALTTQWAVHLAEYLQTAAIVLSDQSLGQSRAVIPVPQAVEFPHSRKTAQTSTEEYRRYVATEDDISPMVLPGTAGCIYTADGLEHNDRGTPSSTAADHLQQLNKHQGKLKKFDFSAHWAEIVGHGDAAIITWGSSSGACLEAAARLQAEGTGVRVIALRLLAPLQKSLLTDSLAGVCSIMVVEQNHSAQLYHYLCSHDILPKGAGKLARPGPLPIRPAEIVAAFKRYIGDEHLDSEIETKTQAL